MVKCTEMSHNTVAQLNNFKKENDKSRKLYVSKQKHATIFVSLPFGSMLPWSHPKWSTKTRQFDLWQCARCFINLLPKLQFLTRFMGVCFSCISENAHYGIEPVRQYQPRTAGLSRWKLPAEVLHLLKDECGAGRRWKTDSSKDGRRWDAACY